MKTRVLVGLPAICAVLVLPPVASADTFTVTKRSDPVPGDCTPSDCSLREAVLAANNQTIGEADRIVLPNRRRPYELQRPGAGEDGALTGDLDITNDPVRIVHPGRGRATIDANQLDRVFELFAPARLRKLVVTGGRNPGADGGGVRAGASLALVRSRVTGNRNLGSGAGVSISAGRLSLVRSVVSANQSTDAAGFTGGGVQAIGDADVVIRRSRLVGNRATGDGGGFYMGADSARVIDSTIAGNQAPFSGAGIHADGSLPLVIRDSTLSANTTSGSGGGIAAYSRVVIVNSTVAENNAFDHGGGIFGGSSSDVAVNAVTVARNVADSNGDSFGTGGGLYYLDLAPGFEVENSLIALNRLGTGARNDCWADPADPFDSLGHNLVSTTASCPGFDRPTDRVRGNPRIRRLARNGGPTRTVALKANSAAVDAAKRASAPNRDQRGVKRDRRPDIGAYERKRRRR